MTHNYSAETLWEREEQIFSDNRYSRKHLLRFDGGITVPGSSSPSVVPIPYSDPNAIDPEEAMVAAIASCHMLWFLALAAKQGFIVDRYHDTAAGIMEPNEQKKYWLSKVTLRPTILFSGSNLPTPTEIEALHHDAHRDCFIANSVKTVIEVEPQ
jgi:organic hydroperoxide reductase OsmC/OhrA